MEQSELERVVKNIDRRVERIEQILPTLATKQDLKPLVTREEMRAAIQEAIAPLATRAEMQAAIAPLATQVEMQGAIAPLATQVEMQGAIAPLATRAEMREAITREGEETRRHFDVVVESLRGDIRLIAEGQLHLVQRFEDLRVELKSDIAQLDRRVMRLEAAR